MTAPDLPAELKAALDARLHGLSRTDAETSYRVFVNWQDRGRFRGRLGTNFTVLPISARGRLCRRFSQQCLVPALSRARAKA